MPFDHYYWQLREIQRALDRLQPQLDHIIDAIPAAIQAQIDQLRWLEESYTLPTHHLEAVAAIQGTLQVNPVLGGLSLLSETGTEAFNTLEQHQEQLALLSDRFTQVAESITQVAGDLTLRPYELVVNSLVPVEALLGSMSMSEEVLKAATLPQLAFQSFAEEQLELAVATPSIAQVNRLQFVSAAGGLLEDMTRGLELALLMEGSLSTSEIKINWEPNVYGRLAVRAEDVDFEDENFDAEDFVFESCEGKVADLGQQLIRLVYDLNSEAEREGKKPVFKPTTKTLYACCSIPTSVATEDVRFNYVVDQLYFLLYEGSGAAKRLTSERDVDDFEALWRVKHLRLGARHDLDHGGTKEAEKKIRNVGEAFHNLIGAVVPRSPLDWCRAQVNLYEQLVEMLERLWYGDDDSGNSEPSTEADG